MSEFITPPIGYKSFNTYKVISLQYRKSNKGVKGKNHTQLLARANQGNKAVK